MRPNIRHVGHPRGIGELGGEVSLTQVWSQIGGQFRFGRTGLSEIASWMRYVASFLGATPLAWPIH